MSGAQWMAAAGTLAGLIAGNYIYQAFRAHPDWWAAFERSWFQVVAVALVVAMVSLAGRS